MERNTSEITFLVEDIEAVLEMNRILEKENQELKHEVARLKSLISSLKAHDIERKSILWKKIQFPSIGNEEDTSLDPLGKKAPPDKTKFTSPVSPKVLQKGEVVSKGQLPLQPPSLDLMEDDIERRSILWKKIQFSSTGKKEDTSLDPPSKKALPDSTKFAVPMSPNLLKKGEVVPKGPPPPPPPPLPSKSKTGYNLAVRRMPEVIEFYRCLNKRTVQVEKRANVTGTGGDNNNNPRNMIGEIENRSTYLSAVKSDVETQREFIAFLIQEVETAVFRDITGVEAFVKWLDEELSCLVDERAVLKHFPEWPERKTDGLREAAGLFRDFRGIQSEILMYKDIPNQLLHQSLGRIQALQDRLERVTSNTERIREGAIRRYKELHIPCDWMLDTGLYGQIKLSSLKLAIEYMRRVVAEVQSSRCTNPDDIIHQGARFAYRVHQFTGGFDLETKRIFEDLKRLHTAKSQKPPTLVQGLE